jgi:hypothetical protein
MSGIFGGTLFSGEGLGQAADMTITQAEADAYAGGKSGSGGGKSGGGAYMPPGGGGKAPATTAYMPGAPAPTFDTSAYPLATPAADNTMLYVGGAVVAVAALAAVVLMSGGRRGTVTANRGRKGRRSRSRRSR